MDCKHLGDLSTKDGRTFVCVDCGRSERALTADEMRACLNGNPAPVDNSTP